LERLRVAYSLKTKADVYELAVRVLTWTTEQTVQGYEVGRHVDGSFQPLLLPYDINSRSWKSESHNGAIA